MPDKTIQISQSLFPASVKNTRNDFWKVATWSSSRRTFPPAIAGFFPNQLLSIKYATTLLKFAFSVSGALLSSAVTKSLKSTIFFFCCPHEIIMNFVIYFLILFL